MSSSKSQAFDRELKKGSGELLILSVIDAQRRHGYDIGKLIEQRSGGALRFNLASIYPLLSRLEKCGYIKGRWVIEVGRRRRRFYRLTSQGRGALVARRQAWRVFVAAVNRITKGQ
ncbi:MAG: helix-turn-helix transcriptional regulator [Acidobacteriota bacterium]|nr:helix-turn-helix transcriptional regulator [Acidobacteriota bacterium]